MTDRRLRTWSGPALVTALEGVSVLLGFLAQPLLMRSLGPAAYGAYVLAVAVGVMASTLTDFGFNFAGVQRAVELRNQPEHQHRFFWRVLCCKLLVGGVALAVTALLVAIAPVGHGANILLATALSAAAAALFPAWYLLARGRLITMAVALLAGRLAGLVLMVLWVRDAAQVPLAVALTCGAPLLAAAVALADHDFRAVLRWRPVGWLDLGPTLRLGASTVWINALPSLSSACVQGLIGTLGSATTLGQYAAADKVRAALQGLFTAFGNALFPSSVARLGGAGADAQHHSLILLFWQLLLAALMALPLALWPREIVFFISGPGFDEAVGALRVMALAVVSSTLVATLGLQVLLPLKRNARYAQAMLGGLLVQAAALMLLVPAHAASGAAAALVLADALAAAWMLWAWRGRC